MASLLAAVGLFLLVPRAYGGCQDNPDYVDQVWGEPCSEWEGYLCEGGENDLDAGASLELKEHCPAACRVGSCGGGSRSGDCLDNPDYVDMLHGDKCSEWEGYSCEEGEHDLDAGASAEYVCRAAWRA